MAELLSKLVEGRRAVQFLRELLEGGGTVELLGEVLESWRWGEAMASGRGTGGTEREKGGEAWG